MRKCLQIKITSKNNSARQWDNGVSRLKVCVSTGTHKFIVSLVVVRVRAAWVFPARTLTGRQMCATFQHSTDMSVNCILSSGFQMSLPIVGSKADMSLALKPQSHSWQQHNVRGRSSYLAGGPCYLPFNKKEICSQTISQTFTLKTHYTHSADLQCSVSPMAVLSAGKSPFLPLKKTKNKTAYQTFCLVQVKTPFQTAIWGCHRNLTQSISLCCKSELN